MTIIIIDIITNEKERGNVFTVFSAQHLIVHGSVIGITVSLLTIKVLTSLALRIRYQFGLCFPYSYRTVCYIYLLHVDNSFWWNFQC